jgi:ABC-2 type transport system permease protein
VNMQHLLAFLWLRWRLRSNQMRRGGIANVVMLTILLVASVAIAVGLFFIFLVVGLFALKEASGAVLMYVLDGVVLAFLFFWATGLLAELQRSEALSLEKFLHLPVSLTSAFLINYLSSLASVTLLWFLSAMLALSLGLLFSHGLAMLWLLPMLAAFVLMVTALTYQFQGWLAALMTNPRRRRTIIVVATMTFILLAQVPNLVNVLHWQNQSEQHNSARREGKMGERLQGMEQTLQLMNLVLPPGWLPAGLEAIAQGRWWPVALAILGPTLIGSASLWRAYRTTMRLYTGQYTSGPTVGASRPASDRPGRPARAVRTSTELLERKLPWLSEQATATTLAVFRSLLRAPEAKMLLLTPLLLLLIFGSMFLATAGRSAFPEEARPLLGFGAMAMVLLSMSQLLGNQFGFDRDGFRVFVLSPARRRDVLLGKNLAVAPIAMTMALAAAVLVQLIYPIRLDRLLALAPRFVSMYLLYCLVANALSILMPMRIAAGSFQPARSPGSVFKAVFVQLLFLFLFPAVLALTLTPLGIELAAEEMGWRHGLPLDLIFSVLECAVIGFIYGLILRLEGDWLQAREQQILQIVTTRAE